MGAIVWLASYPKSGNTWVRAFLTNYRRNSTTPASINELDGATIASDRRLFDELVGVEASDLAEEEILRCRPEVFRCLARDAEGTVFVKAHDGFRRAGVAIFPTDVTALAVYIIRNPLDVVVSLAHHHGIPIDSVVQRMCSTSVLSPSEHRLGEQLAQVLPGWSSHVLSWLEEPDLPVHMVRSEDIHREPSPRC